MSQSVTSAVFLSIAFFLCVLSGSEFFDLERRATAAEADGAYPNTRRVDHTDEYHGVKVADPYRWLEDDVRVSKEVAAWTVAQNKIARAHLDGIPQRSAIRHRLEKLWNYERYSAPRKRGGHYFYWKNNGLQNQSVVYIMDKLNGEPRVLLDPNKWSEDGTIALAGFAPDEEGRYVAYGTAEAGSDWRTWRVMEIETGKVLDEVVRWTKSGGVSWTRDGRGFFYGRFPQPEPGQEFQSLNLNKKIYYHRVGTPQAEDTLVYQRPEEPTWGFYTNVSEDGRYLVITVAKGTDNRYRVLVRDLAEPYGIAREVVDNFDHEYSYLGNDGPIFYFQTDHLAPRGRVIAMDIRRPEKEHHREVIPQAEEALNDINLVGNQFVALYLKDAQTQAKVFSIQGEFLREVKFPGIGSASGFGGHRSDTETFYTFQSFTTPPTIYRYNLLTGESQLFRQDKVAFNPEEYVVQQVFTQSKDGTRVPMFISHKKGMKWDGSNPTLLYGYGGFSISILPRFSVSNLAWMEMGGVYAVANLRGGGEYGEEWHRGGKKLEKQNVFDDFIAAAEWLIENKVTNPKKLAIEGRSNGGLLVGATMTQRPELFGACLPAVGVMDMLRFHKFTAGRYWVDDYGSADDPDEFKALLAYSPYHNIKPGTRYPPTMVITADTDDRVVPSHSFKFGAAMQHAQSGDAPIILRIESRAGHGAGTPTSKRIDAAADLLAFLVKHLGLPTEGQSE